MTYSADKVIDCLFQTDFIRQTFYFYVIRLFPEIVLIRCHKTRNDFITNQGKRALGMLEIQKMCA